ncbi:MAG: hypothetical protein ACLVBA_16965 [Alistipes finegoldii]|uniref:hypothetical protein n=1 Tax=Alistipes finegoldii TaxID=214856 RepID=UPI00399D2B89
MKDQVTSIEQSKRLVELGVPADKASMVYRKRYIKNDYVLDMESREMEVIAPAFTVADLLKKVLPNVIQDAHNTYELTLKAVVGGGWRFCYTPVLTPLEADNIGDEMGDNLIELLCNRIEWIVSNGYGLNL